MRHKDSAGHEGVIEPGGIQWMTAGRGIVHSEMPEQQAGLLEGFQLWVNLPAAHKMDAPAYQEHGAAAIPAEARDDGVVVRVIAGETSRGTRGPVMQPLTEPLYIDVELPAGASFRERLPKSHNGFVYLVEGTLIAEDLDDTEVRLGRDDLAVLSRGDTVAVRAGDGGVRFLLVAGRPLNEPVARGGPFVMNTKAEIRQAYADYEAGRL
jgi:redox-sensitive bicupin YhaK (pirin superfamily)